MSASPRFPTDQEDDIPREMLELGRRIATMPDPHYDRLVDPYAQVVDCFKRRKRILTWSKKLCPSCVSISST